MKPVPVTALRTFAAVNGVSKGPSGEMLFGVAFLSTPMTEA